MDLLNDAPVYDAATVRRLFGHLFLLPIDDGPPPAPLPGYITLWDPGWSLVILRTKRAVQKLFRRNWYVHENFAAEGSDPGYRQVRPHVADSLGLLFEEGQQLLGPDEVVPTPRLLVLALAVHFLATGERVLQKNSSLSSCASGGVRLFVGFPSEGIEIGCMRENCRDSAIGLASQKR